MAVSDILPMSHAKYNDQLFRSAAFTDCTIKCQNRLWHLHRAILSPRCEFFWKCFDGPWEESSATITMHDDDPDTLERMLRWIYTLEWPTTTQTNDDEEEQQVWTADLMLYILADKYGLSELMEQAREAILRTADSCSTTSQKTASQLFVKHVDDFVDMLGWLFNDPPERDDVLELQRQLLRTMAPMMARHMRDQPRLAELIRTLPGFGLEFVEALARANGVEEPSKTSAVREVVSQGRRNQSITSNSSSRQASPRKVYIPMNDESEDELE